MRWAPVNLSFIRSFRGDDCLLKVKWAPDNDDGYLNFHSVSGDGRVSNWTLVKVLRIIIFFKVFMAMVIKIIMMLNL